jgi:hypothetical protein
MVKSNRKGCSNPDFGADDDCASGSASCRSTAWRSLAYAYQAVDSRYRQCNRQHRLNDTFHRSRHRRESANRYRNAAPKRCHDNSTSNETVLLERCCDDLAAPESCKLRLPPEEIRTNLIVLMLFRKARTSHSFRSGEMAGEVMNRHWAAPASSSVGLLLLMGEVCSLSDNRIFYTSPSRLRCNADWNSSRSDTSEISSSCL